MLNGETVRTVLEAELSRTAKRNQKTLLVKTGTGSQQSDKHTWQL